jgi:hypothetical protein
MTPLSRRTFVAACLIPLVAMAQESAVPVGTWSLDRDAWRAELDRLIPELMGQLPAEARRTMEARDFDLASELRRSLSRGLDGTFELRSDGSLVAFNGQGEPDGEGRWRPAADDLIELSLPEERLTLRGRVDGDRMLLYIVPEAARTAADPLVRALVEAMTIEMVRRQG